MLQRRVLRIILASPGDVKAEREALPVIVSELNRDVAAPLNLTLELAMWETEARPGLHSEGPQGLIDSALNIQDCDLLIGVFWKRFGTPTHDAQSGTEHEINRAYENWKKNQKPQIMLYFNEKPWTPVSRAELDQYAKILDFRQGFPKEGLWWPYKSVPEFTRVVRAHVTKFLNELSTRPSRGRQIVERLKSIISSGSEQHENVLTEQHENEEVNYSDFLEQYRERFSGFYSRWDLSPVGVTQSGGAGRPIEVKLDDIYLPLRFGQGYSVSILNEGTVYSHLAILTREKPLVIRGVAGSGKTTWMRWTFRKLLLDDEAIPIMVELRRVALKWQSHSAGRQRSLDSYIDDEIAEHVGPSWQGWLPRIIKSKSAPRPILLVDGWDELGSLGEEFRGKLVGFMKAHPRLMVVVSSRPYGEGRPSHSEGFDVLDIQPLSDKEIQRFTQTFFSLCYAQEQSTVDDYVNRFAAALERSPETLSLVRTALLLTMMLLISRSSPLPDKRHLLYQKCVENLLTALPDRKKEEGARTTHDQWRPDDTEERLRVTSILAFRVQESGYKDQQRATIVRPWNEMLTFLPASWSHEQRSRFLNWLVGPAGLLIDRADGTLSFAHLSFQEYLSAWYLHTNIEGDSERTEACCQKLGALHWWETLRLWAALVGGQQPSKIAPVMDALLRKGIAGLSLTGCMLADGSGPEKIFREWCSKFLVFTHDPWTSDVLLVLTAWSGSRQEHRKQMMAQALPDMAQNCDWFGWMRLREWARKVGLHLVMPFPRESNACALLEAQYQVISSPRHVAVGRILSSVPFWPGEPWELLLLQSWPSRRRFTGHFLQAAAMVGFSRNQIIDLTKRLPHLLRPFPAEVKVPPQFDVDSIKYAIADLDDLDLPAQERRCFTVSYLTDWFLQIGPLPASIGTPAIWVNVLQSTFRTECMGREWTRENANIWTRALSTALASKTIDTESPLRRTGPAFAGPLGILAFLACVEIGRVSGPIDLISSACRIALNPGLSTRHFKKALRLCTEKLDPLWPMLARHLALRGTRGDQSRLCALAASPEQRDGVLGWGLKYIVRGDVILSDGSELTLDELTSELGLKQLPYLEDYPEFPDLPCPDPETGWARKGW